MKKKILAMLLAVMMIAAMLPTAFADDDAVTTDDDVLLSAPADGEDAAEPDASNKCGENVTWTYADGVLTISGTGAMDDYGYDRETETDPRPWVDFLSEIKTAVIEEGVTAIGNNAFDNCTALASVTIADTVTTIGKSAFSSCGLTSVTIPSSVTTIDISAFANCHGLTEVTIPAGVTAINDMAFWACSKLTSITIEAADVEIGDMALGFYMRVYYNDEGEPAGAREAVLDGVTIYGYADSTAQAYAEENGITFTALDSESEDPTEPAEPEDSDFVIEDGVLVKYVGEGSDVVIPDGVTTIGSTAFHNCSSLTSVTIPNGVTTIGDYAFILCPSVTSVTIPVSITDIGLWAFSGCTNLTDVYYGGTEAQWGEIGTYGPTNEGRVPYAEGGQEFAGLENVTIHFAEDEEPTEPENPFTDVPAGEWYADSVLWAVEKGITTGTDDGTTFEPDRDCHDIEILTMLYRADSGESQGNGGDMAGAAAWALENGLISEDYDVTAECTRATAVWYIWKVLGADDTAPAYSFTDVEADAEYAAAVNWAVATGVTNGSEDGTTFSPGDPCSRGMIVTFLYRAYANSVSE